MSGVRNSELKVALSVKIKCAIISCLLIVCAMQANAQEKFTYSGYTKDLASAIHVRGYGDLWDNLVHNRAIFGWQIDTSWSMRAE